MRPLLLAIAALATAACVRNVPATTDGSPGNKGPALELVAQSPRQWTGIAVSKTGRIFVNFPRWSEDVPISVAELKDGQVSAWPDATWNEWTPGTTHPNRFVAVQSVVIDDEDRLWVVETGNPWFKGVIATPRLHQFDISNGQLVRSYSFPPEVSSGDSYLNDVRFDTEREVAYLTDSQAGGLVILDLKTGSSRKVLKDHPSTHAEVDHLMVLGRRFDRQVQSDGIALSPDRQTLYWSALTGHTLWRIPTEALLDKSLDDKALAGRVEKAQTIVAPDGILFDSQGVLWLGGLEDGAIYRYVPGGSYERVIQDARLLWPDSFAEGPQRWIYVTTTQIHLPPAERGPYGIYRFQP